MGRAAGAGHRRRHPRADRPGALHRQPLQRPHGLRARRSRGAARRRGDTGRRQRRARRRRPAFARIDVETTAELADGGRDASSSARHVLLMAAAPADFRAAAAPRPERSRARARTRCGSTCERDRGHPRRAARRRGATSQTLVGFAAEHGAEAIERAREKLERKGVDAIVFNDVSRAEIGFDSEHNEVVIVEREGEHRVAARPQGARWPRRSSTGSRRCAAQLVGSRLRRIASSYTVPACRSRRGDEPLHALPPGCRAARGRQLRARPPCRSPRPPAGAREELGPRGARPRLLPQPPVRGGGGRSSRRWSRRHPVNDYAHFCLGRALSLTGQRDRARHHLALASNLRPERRDYRIYRERLAAQPRERPLEGAGPAREPRLGRRRRARGSRRSAPGVLVLLGVAPATTPRPRPTGSPTRSARCGSSTTPTGA